MLVQTCSARSPERGGDGERAQPRLDGAGKVALGPQQVGHAGVDLPEAIVVVQGQAELLGFAEARHGASEIAHRVERVRQPESEIGVLLARLAALGQMGERRTAPARSTTTASRWA